MADIIAVLAEGEGEVPIATKKLIVFAFYPIISNLFFSILFISFLFISEILAFKLADDSICALKCVRLFNFVFKLANVLKRAF